MEYSWRKGRREPSVWKGAVAGVVGVIVASWALNEFSSLIKTVAESGSNGQKQKAKKSGEQQQEDPTITTAEKISETVADIKLNKEQKQTVATVVHYAFGALMGAVYGAAAEVAPPVKSLAGLPYGSPLFVPAAAIMLQDPCLS